MHELHIQEILKLIKAKQGAELKKELEEYHPSDLADALQSLEKEERFKIYQAIGLEASAELFPYFDDVEDYINELSPSVAADIIEQLDSDDAIEVLNELEDDDKEEILSLMEEDSKASVKLIDSYDEDKIAHYMTDNYIYIKNDFTVKQAMAKVIKEAGEHDNVYTIYVVDNDNKYFGAINLKDLIVARVDDSLLDICMENYPSFYDDEDISDIINKLKDYKEASIPILNHDNKILGVITSDNILDAVEDELSEDYAKLAGLQEVEELDDSTLKSVRKRIPWLIILLFLGFIVSSTIGIFESVIAIIPVIVFFQSMILDMAGNVGTQSLAITIRNLTTEESDKTHLKNIFKEIKIGFLNGIIVGIIAFLFIMIYLVIRQDEIISGRGFNMFDVCKVSGIISFSLLVGMTISSLVGSTLPLILNKCHIDPAVASGPFITTINDIIAVLVYYGLTYLLFILVL